jgi:hypothetical protein
MTRASAREKIRFRHALCWTGVHIAEPDSPFEAGLGDIFRSEDGTMSTRNPRDTENGTIKDPSEWTTGDEPMTGAQESYLHTLARKAGEDVGDDDLTKAEASMKIDELREKTELDESSIKAKRKAASE